MSARAPSLVARLTRANMLACAAGLLLASVGFMVFDAVSLRATMVQQLGVQARVTAANSVAALTFDDADAAGATLAALRASPRIRFAGIYRPEGDLFAAFRRDGEEAVPSRLAPLPAATRHRFGGDTLELHEPIALDGRPLGTVVLRADLSEVAAGLLRSTGLVAVVLLVSLLGALVVARRSSGVVSRPMVELAGVVRAVQSTRDYSLRTHSRAEVEEVRALATAFDEMLAVIEDRDSSLRRASLDLERRVTERTAELTAANQELEAFSYSVSHDLRAPLRTIVGFGEMLVEDFAEALPAEAQRYVSRMGAAARTMESLIDDLLRLGHVTRAALERDDVDLSALAGEVADDLRQQHAGHDVELTIAPGLAVVGDRRLLRVVLVNLLGNAWKYTSHHPRARVEVGRLPDSGIFFVRDDGAGFDPAHAAQLFTAFHRLHAPHEFAGTGVGLAMVQRILHRHGGEIWAEAAVEQGATFFFTVGPAPAGHGAVHALAEAS